MQYQKLLAAGLALTLFACSNNEQKDYTVKGEIKNIPAKTVYLEEISLQTMQPVIVDSSSIKENGDYELNTLSKGEAIYNLRLAGNSYPFVSFINDTKDVTINADFKNVEDPYTINGSPASQSLKDFLVTLGQKANALQAIKLPADTQALKKPQRDSIRYAHAQLLNGEVKDVKRYAADFIAKSKNVPLTLYALSSYQSIASYPAVGLEPFTMEELNNIISIASKQFPGHPAIATIQQKLQGKPVPGAAPDFTLPDVNGKPVALSSFKGKFVLVDFWASWCPPCRAENPNVVAAYNKYKDKNFTILGVSLDKEKDPWLKAIKDDNLTWTHVSDLAFWDSKVVPLYRIDAIPYNVLLDPEGKVIAERLTGAELEKKLAELLQ